MTAATWRAGANGRCSGERRARRSANNGCGALGRSRGVPWLTTYADLVILLLTFFILLLSMSIKDETRMKKALGSVAGALGRAAYQGGKSGGAGRGDLEALREMVAGIAPPSETEIWKEGERTVMRMNRKILFQPGSTDLLPEASSLLGALGRFLERNGEEVEIRGYTDGMEALDSAPWPGGSWEISTRRARNVYDALRGSGVDAGRMSARGYGDGRPAGEERENGGAIVRSAGVDVLIGRNDSIPSRISARTPGARSPLDYLNYKNFRFRLPFVPRKGRGGDAS
ncbi:MAG: flagellar motor protein MotB [Syntrophobacteraceae bacterium]